MSQMKIVRHIDLPDGRRINVGDLITRWPSTYGSLVRDAQMPFLILEIGYFGSGILQFKMLTKDFEFLYDQIGVGYACRLKFLARGEFPSLQTSPGGI